MHTAGAGPAALFQACDAFSCVMPGLVPGIHAKPSRQFVSDRARPRRVDSRLKAGHDGALAPSADQISFAIATAVSDMRFEKPHSLSYQDRIDTKVPSITLVWSMWKIEECGSWLKSIETFLSSV